MQRLPLASALTGALLLVATSVPSTLAAGAQTDGQAGPAYGHRDLVQRIEALKAALATEVCQNPAVAALLQSTGALQGTPPAGDSNVAKPDVKPVPPLEEATLAPDAAHSRPLTRANLVKKLQNAVVLVIADKSTGSGFFVMPDVVVTNDHVLDSPNTHEVLVVGHGIGTPRKARVLARVSGKDFNARDYALLKVEGVQVKEFLSLTTATGELANVVAAGYPGLLLENDMNFRALIRGDMQAMPDLALSQGVVMALQNRDRGMMVIAHSAPISSGNSGGPLVDRCGNVMGINTFVNASAKQGASAGFALGSADLIEFLKSQGMEPSAHQGTCQE